MVMCRPFILNSPTKTRIAKMQQFKMQFTLIEHANYCCYETIRKTVYWETINFVNCILLFYPMKNFKKNMNILSYILFRIVSI